MSKVSYASQHIGPALVIGGSGFLGSHVVEQLLKEPNRVSITSASRSPRAGTCFDGAKYEEVDLNDGDAVAKLISKIQPEVIFYVAAPRAVDGANNPAVFYDTIVNGTRNILDISKAAPSVRVLVYTSTCAVHTGYEHFDLKEDAPMWDENSSTFPYYQAKALADKMVLVENCRQSKDAGQKGYAGSLLTTTLRLPMCYGERDAQGIPGQLEAFQKGQTKIQLGDGTNRVEPAYGPVVAQAHLLAAKALLATSSGRIPSDNDKVDGEAFFITNGESQPFWDFSRHVWRLVGDTTDPKDVRVISGWLALTLSGMVEWGFAILTLGFKKPPLNLTRLYIGYAINNATYSIEKARARLGFQPTVDLDASLRSSVQSTLTNDTRFKDMKLAYDASGISP